MTLRGEGESMTPDVVRSTGRPPRGVNVFACPTQVIKERS